MTVIAAVPFKELVHTLTFTKRNESTWDEENSDGVNRFYQRETNKERLKSLKKYIAKALFNDKDEKVLFPTTVLLGIEGTRNDIVYSNNDIFFDLTLEDYSEEILIVDGQHRLMAIKELYDEYKFSDTSKFNKISQLKISCTFLINYDLWEQAKIFADVNFKQKPVDRSLYYDIFGEIYDEDKNDNNTLFIAHKLGKFLNTSERSPLKGFVRTLGSKDGFVSQAFLTTALMSNLSVRGPWAIVMEDIKSNNSKLSVALPNLLVGYFNSVKDNFSSYWPNDFDRKKSGILPKTTGLGALIKLLAQIDKQLQRGFVPGFEKMVLMNLEVDQIKSVFDKMFAKIDANKKEDLFGENGKYAGQGSAGAQGKLYKELAHLLGVPTK